MVSSCSVDGPLELAVNARGSAHTHPRLFSAQSGSQRRAYYGASLAIAIPSMTSKPFRSRVRVLELGTLNHVFIAFADEARDLVDTRLAIPLDEPGDQLIRCVELMISISDLEQRMLAKRNQRPRRPMRAPASESGGDSGRGRLGHRFRTLHLRPSQYGTPCTAAVSG